MSIETPPALTPAEDLARALARFLAETPAAGAWAKYPPVLGVAEVAEILGLKRSAVSERARAGKIPMVKRCNRYIIDQDGLRDWVAGREPAARPSPRDGGAGAAL